MEAIEGDRIAVAAYERLPEIISEASRRIGDDLKEAASKVPWRRVADVGNVQRHADRRTDLATLWAIHVSDLPQLRDAITLMNARLQDLEAGESDTRPRRPATLRAASCYGGVGSRGLSV